MAEAILQKDIPHRGWFEGDQVYADFHSYVGEMMMFLCYTTLDPNEEPELLSENDIIILVDD